MRGWGAGGERAWRSGRGAAGLAAALALLLGVGRLAAAAPEPASDAELRALREAIESRRERVGELEQTQRDLLELLEAIDRRAQRLAREARAARREAREAREEAARVEARVARLEERLARTRRAMAQRAVALYKAGELGPAQALFTAGSLPELLGRIEALRRLLSHDRELLARYRRDRAALGAARTEAERAAAAGERAAERARARARELAAERTVRGELLRRARASRSRERTLLAELEAAARALEETLHRLPEGAVGEPAPETSLAARRGTLPRPVDAPFAPEASAAEAQAGREGVTFRVPAGTPVRTVAAGTVRLADWFRGYGRVVILDHGGGTFSVSGHLDEIRVEVGERVEAGDVIGTVGDTGSLDGPKLYFELREGRRALDPAEWLAPGPAS